MNEIKLLNIKESAKAEQNWISKKELAEICKCDVKTLERIVTEFNCDIDVATQNHMNKLLVVLIAKLTWQFKIT